MGRSEKMTHKYIFDCFLKRVFFLFLTNRCIGINLLFDDDDDDNFKQIVDRHAH